MLYCVFVPHHETENKTIAKMNTNSNPEHHMFTYIKKIQSPNITSNTS